MPDSTNYSANIIAASKEQDFAGRAVIGAETDGTIVYWNAPAAALYGWSESDAIGKNVLDVKPTQTLVDEALFIMEHMRAGRDWAGDFMVRRPDRTPVVMHVTTKPVLDQEKVIGVVGISYLDSRRTPGSMRAVQDE